LASIADIRQTVPQRSLGGSFEPVDRRTRHHQRVATRPIGPGQGS